MANVPQKVLFADLYQLNAIIKDEIKINNKSIDMIIDTTDWAVITQNTEAIIDQAQRISNCALEMIDKVNAFLEDGPYQGQTGDMRPLETLAARRS